MKMLENHPRENRIKGVVGNESGSNAVMHAKLRVATRSGAGAEAGSMPSACHPSPRSIKPVPRATEFQGTPAERVECGMISP